ncbi:SseB family protein [Solirhodobacter olei]|uniref:SseB family protein n=1 Tax=Solirhodobacter olei TaxID=2493082 RepID=UPI000FDA196F|nr:SseB family protein [Solirhodobacter olei]
MSEETDLDAAHRAMEAAPEDGAARLAFYARLCDSEVFLLLEREAEGEDLSPRVFDLAEGPVVLAFDQEERLAEFAGAPAPYAALPGRVLAGLLAGQGIGLGVNLEVAPSSVLLPADAVDWLAQMVSAGPEVVAERPVEVGPPAGLPAALRGALERALSRSAGLAQAAWLAAVVYEGGRQGHVLAFEAAAEGAEAALARAASEALAFSGVEAGGIDVMFLAAGDPVLARLARVGERFDLAPRAEPETARGPKPPGMDPKRPPILR